MGARIHGGVIDCEVTPPEEILLETLMLGLRLAEGVSLAALAEEFGEEKVVEIYQCLRSHFDKGWVEVVEGKIAFVRSPRIFVF